jgi:hypothetical protein
MLSCPEAADVRKEGGALLLPATALSTRPRPVSSSALRGTGMQHGRSSAEHAFVTGRGAHSTWCRTTTWTREGVTVHLATLRACKSCTVLDVLFPPLRFLHRQIGLINRSLSIQRVDRSSGRRCLPNTSRRGGSPRRAAFRPFATRCGNHPESGYVMYCAAARYTQAWEAIQPVIVDFRSASDVVGPRKRSHVAARG